MEAVILILTVQLPFFKSPLSFKNYQTASLFFHIRKEKRLNKAEDHAPSIYSTGVRGIKMKFITEKRIRAGELRTYYTPVFIVSGSNDNKRFGKKFNILTQGYQSAWSYAVLYYAMNKDLTDPNNVLERLPPVEKFMIIIKEMRKTGHKVPKRRLPVELWNNSQVRMALGKMA